MGADSLTVDLELGPYFGTIDLNVKRGPGSVNNRIEVLLCLLGDHIEMLFNSRFIRLIPSFEEFTHW